MASKAQKRPLSLQLLLVGTLVIWMIAAAFPFFWTLWGSFKVDLVQTGLCTLGQNLVFQKKKIDFELQDIINLFIFMKTIFVIKEIIL